MRLSCMIMDIRDLKYIGATTFTFWGKVTLSVT